MWVSTSEETDRLLQVGVYGVLSTAGSGGLPYGVPLNYVYHKNVIYFHCAVDGLKLDLLNQNNMVSFCVVDKYSAGYLEPGIRYLEKAWERTKVYRIDIEHCTGKGTLTSHPG